MSHCKACDKILDNPPMRYIEEANVVVEENLCPRCLEIAIAATFNKDLTDDQEYMRQLRLTEQRWGGWGGREAEQG